MENPTPEEELERILTELYLSDKAISKVTVVVVQLRVLSIIQKPKQKGE